MDKAMGRETRHCSNHSSSTRRLQECASNLPPPTRVLLHIYQTKGPGPLGLNPWENHQPSGRDNSLLWKSHPYTEYIKPVWPLSSRCWSHSPVVVTIINSAPQHFSKEKRQGVGELLGRADFISLEGDFSLQVLKFYKLVTLQFYFSDKSMAEKEYGKKEVTDDLENTWGKFSPNNHLLGLGPGKSKCKDLWAKV